MKYLVNVYNIVSCIPIIPQDYSKPNIYCKHVTPIHKLYNKLYTTIVKQNRMSFRDSAIQYIH